MRPDSTPDRLAVAVQALAGNVKVGDETARFADPDDALLYIERQLANGELTAAEVYDDDGRVKRAALSSALSDLLADKPHLRGSDPSTADHLDAVHARQAEREADTKRILTPEEVEQAGADRAAQEAEREQIEDAFADGKRPEPIEELTMEQHAAAVRRARVPGAYVGPEDYR